MSYAHRIIEKFGGIRATARALSRPPSTVKGWKDRGTIPDPEKTHVLSAANAMGLDVSRDDFWPGEESEGASV
jgi:hypothetical protein